jgi:hypothetical protein
MKCPTCNGRRRVSTPCQVGHTNVHDCYEAGCLLPHNCKTCLGEGHVVTDDVLNDPAKLRDFVAQHC